MVYTEEAASPFEGDQVCVCVCVKYVRVWISPIELINTPAFRGVVNPGSGGLLIQEGGFNPRFGLNGGGAYESNDVIMFSYSVHFQDSLRARFQYIFRITLSHSAASDVVETWWRSSLWSGGHLGGSSIGVQYAAFTFCSCPGAASASGH